MASRTLSPRKRQPASPSPAEAVACVEYLSAAQLRELTVDQLLSLYSRFPERVEARIAAGREHFTRFYESRIVSELSLRTPADDRERTAIASCLSSHRAEMANMAAVLGLPFNPSVLSSSDTPPPSSSRCSFGSTRSTSDTLSTSTISSSDSFDILAPDPTRRYTPDELIALLHLYTPCRNLVERERLVEYVDYSLNLLITSPDPQPLANLAAELAELDRRHIVRSPRWLRTYLTDAISRWLTSPTVPDTDIVLPLLTASLLNLTVTPPHRRPISPSSLERRAQRIINRCYRTALSVLTTPFSSSQLPSLISSLHIAATCPTYVTRFSVRRLASAWNLLTTYSLYISTSDIIDTHFSRVSISPMGEYNFISCLPTSYILSLLLVAEELAALPFISYPLHQHLLTLLEEKTVFKELRSIIYFRNLEVADRSLATAV